MFGNVVAVVECVEVKVGRGVYIYMDEFVFVELADLLVSLSVSGQLASLIVNDHGTCLRIVRKSAWRCKTRAHLESLVHSRYPSLLIPCSSTLFSHCIQLVSEDLPK
jgi:hypothetical protein